MNGGAEGTARYPGAASNYIMKSPMVSTRSKFVTHNNDSNSKLHALGSKISGGHGTSLDINNSDSWIISPVCSRLRDHI